MSFLKKIKVLSATKISEKMVEDYEFQFNKALANPRFAIKGNKALMLAYNEFIPSGWKKAKAEDVIGLELAEFKDVASSAEVKEAYK